MFSVNHPCYEQLWPSWREHGEYRTRLRGYRGALERSFGSYFTLGRVFVRAIGHPQVMKACARYGLPRPTLMKLVLKLMANLYEPARGDATDRVVRAMVRLAPSR